MIMKALIRSVFLHESQAETKTLFKCEFEMFRVSEDRVCHQCTLPIVPYYKGHANEYDHEPPKTKTNQVQRVWTYKSNGTTSLTRRGAILK